MSSKCHLQKLFDLKIPPPPHFKMKFGHDRVMAMQIQHWYNQVSQMSKDIKHLKDCLLIMIC